MVNFRFFIFGFGKKMQIFEQKMKLSKQIFELKFKDFLKLCKICLKSSSLGRKTANFALEWANSRPKQRNLPQIVEIFAPARFEIFRPAGPKS